MKGDHAEQNQCYSSLHISRDHLQSNASSNPMEFHHSMREQMPHIYVSKVLFSKNGSLESQNFPTNRLIECKDSNGCTEHKNRIDNSLCNAKLCIENALEFENKSSTKADLDKDILNGENSSKLVCGSYIQEESCYGAGGVVGAKLCVCCSGTDGQTTQSSSKLYNQHNCLRTSQLNGLHRSLNQLPPIQHQSITATQSVAYSDNKRNEGEKSFNHASITPSIEKCREKPKQLGGGCDALTLSTPFQEEFDQVNNDRGVGEEIIQCRPISKVDNGCLFFQKSENALNVEQGTDPKSGLLSTNTGFLTTFAQIPIQFQQRPETWQIKVGPPQHKSPHSDENQVASKESHPNMSVSQDESSRSEGGKYSNLVAVNTKSKEFLPDKNDNIHQEPKARDSASSNSKYKETEQCHSKASTNILQSMNEQWNENYAAPIHELKVIQQPLITLNGKIATSPLQFMNDQISHSQFLIEGYIAHSPDTSSFQESIVKFTTTGKGELGSKGKNKNRERSFKTFSTDLIRDENALSQFDEPIDQKMASYEKSLSKKNIQNLLNEKEERIKCSSEVAKDKGGTTNSKSAAVSLTETSLEGAEEYTKIQFQIRLQSRVTQQSELPSPISVLQMALEQSQNISSHNEGADTIKNPWFLPQSSEFDEASVDNSPTRASNSYQPGFGGIQDNHEDHKSNDNPSLLQQTSLGEGTQNASNNPASNSKENHGRFIYVMRQPCRKRKNKKNALELRSQGEPNQDTVQNKDASSSQKAIASQLEGRPMNLNANKQQTAIEIKCENNLPKPPMDLEPAGHQIQTKSKKRISCDQFEINLKTSAAKLIQQLHNQQNNSQMIQSLRNMRRKISLPENDLLSSDNVVEVLTPKSASQPIDMHSPTITAQASIALKRRKVSGNSSASTASNASASFGSAEILCSNDFKGEDGGHKKQTLKQENLSKASSKSLKGMAEDVKGGCRRKAKLGGKNGKKDGKESHAASALVLELLAQIRGEHDAVSDYNLVVERLVTKYRDQQQQIQERPIAISPTTSSCSLNNISPSFLPVVEVSAKEEQEVSEQGEQMQQQLEETVLQNSYVQVVPQAASTTTTQSQYQYQQQHSTIQHDYESFFGGSGLQTIPALVASSSAPIFDYYQMPLENPAPFFNHFDMMPTAFPLSLHAHASAPVGASSSQQIAEATQHQLQQHFDVVGGTLQQPLHHHHTGMNHIQFNDNFVDQASFSYYSHLQENHGSLSSAEDLAGAGLLSIHRIYQ